MLRVYVHSHTNHPQDVLNSLAVKSLGIAAQSALGAPEIADPFYNLFWEKSWGPIRLWLLGLIFLIGCGYPLSWLFSVADALPYANIYAFLGAFSVGFGFWVAKRTYKRTVDIINEIRPFLSEVEREKLVKSFNLVYSNRYLLIVGFGFSLLAVIHWMKFGLILPRSASFFVDLWIVIAGFSGFGLWMAAASLFLVKTMLPCNYQYYFRLNPARSIFIRKISGLFLEYAIGFAIEVLPFAVGFTIFSYSTQQLVSLGRIQTNIVVLTTSTVLVTLIFVVIMPLYFLLPQLIIRSAVKKVKSLFIQTYQNRLNELVERSRSGLTQEESREFDALVEVEDTLEKSGALPLGFMDLAKPFLSLAPSIGALFASRTILDRLLVAAKHIFPWLKHG